MLEGENMINEVAQVNEEIYDQDLVDCEHNEFSEKLSIPKRDLWKEHATIQIDRSQEDKDVLKFQQNGDMRLLEKLYNNRIPTLKVWATKNFYPGLAISQDDLFEELSVVFVKAAQHFDKSRGNFNTCLFNFLLNRIKNMKNGMHAKKRVSETYEGPRAGMVLSLDYAYNDKDGSDVTLKDIIPDPEYDGKKTPIEDTVEVLAGGNTVLRDFLYKVSHGESISNLLKEAKQKEGTFKINSSSIKKIKNGGKKVIKELLKDHKVFDQEFEVVEYKLTDLDLVFKVQLRKTKEYEMLSKAIRNFKKNKKQYISRIKFG